MLHDLPANAYLKDAVLAFIDMFHKEHRTSYAKDVETLKSLVGEAIFLEDLDKGILYLTRNASGLAREPRPFMICNYELST